MTKIKICGVTSVDDARMCVDAGTDALGLNFWPGSPRRCDPAVAAEIAAAVRGRVWLVGVFVNAKVEEVRALRRVVGFHRAQLHGDEDRVYMESLGVPSFKALRAGGPGDLVAIESAPGDPVLLDASVPGMVGGTGQRADWSLAAKVARRRRVLLAGGLRPDNVADAVLQVRPWGVDVASGVEISPGKKDAEKVRAFIDAVRGVPLSSAPGAR